MGPPVAFVGTTLNTRYLMIKYSDSSFVMLDRSVGSPSQAIMGHSFGHFQRVSGMQWMTKSSINKRGSLSDQSQADAFITCADDMSVFVWRHFGDRFSFSYIDVIKCFDSSLTYSRKLSDKSTYNLKLTAIKVYPKMPMVIVGDSKGVVRIFQVTQDRAVFLA